MKATIIGVYPIKAPEPCHCIEIEFDEIPEDLDWEKITQEDPKQPQ